MSFRKSIPVFPIYLPVFGVILDNAQRIDPDESYAKFTCYDYGILKRFGQRLPRNVTLSVLKGR